MRPAARIRSSPRWTAPTVREPTLCNQAVNATLGHAQATVRPTPEQVQQIVDFELGIFSAQLRDKKAKRLDKNGGLGRPINLETFTDTAHLPNFTPFNEYDAWDPANGVDAAKQAIFRGQVIFNTRMSIQFSGRDH